MHAHNYVNLSGLYNFKFVVLKNLYSFITENNSRQICAETMRGRHNDLSV